MERRAAFPRCAGPRVTEHPPGYRAVENPVSVHDLHATMLQLCGIDHKRLNMKFQGLDVRLTGIAGEAVKGIVA